MTTNEAGIEIRARRILHENRVVVDMFEPAGSYRQIAERLGLLSLEDRGPIVRPLSARHEELLEKVGHMLAGVKLSSYNEENI